MLFLSNPLLLDRLGTRLTAYASSQAQTS